MQIVSLTSFRQNLRMYLEQVFNSGSPLFISRPKGKDMVVLSKDEYNSMQETFHLLKSPTNATRILDAIQEDKAGEGLVRDLID